MLPPYAGTVNTTLPASSNLTAVASQTEPVASLAAILGTKSLPLPVAPVKIAAGLTSAAI